jgi:hypothetical protein
MLTTATRRATAPSTARSRRYRQRRRDGKALVPVELDDLVAASEYLVGVGLLAAWDCDDRQAIGRALAALVKLLIADEARRQDTY